jgi:hypothetical protein
MFCLILACQQPKRADMQLRIHQLNILKRLEKGPRTLKSFSHNDQSAHLSVHFERYLAELQAAGYVVEIQELWHLTHSGYAAVAEKQQKKVFVDRICAGTTEGFYDGKELTRTCMRPGAYDFLEYPSLMGDKRFYRSV